MQTSHYFSLADSRLRPPGAFQLGFIFIDVGPSSNSIERTYAQASFEPLQNLLGPPVLPCEAPLTSLPPPRGQARAFHGLPDAEKDEVSIENAQDKARAPRPARLSARAVAEAAERRNKTGRGLHVAHVL